MKTLMNWRFALIILFLASSVASFAQTSPTTDCSSDHKNDSLYLHDPKFARSLFLLEAAFHQNMNMSPEDRTDDVYVLPVVVHVIHEGEPIGQGSNISDEQILSAITALNDDYRHVPGTNGFGAGPDIKIEFCLASRDPQGQPTTGINRVNGSSIPLYAEEGIESTGGAGANEEAVKALSTWPRTDYVNIWVVNEIGNNDGGSGVQGYAYFPINNPIDGIVVLHNAFGTVGNLKSYTNMNRTLTHEMGHFLGLYHTFHETNACGAESNCETQGDRVCDTPPTILNASCSAPACSGTQQVENYLDYTNQSCQDMFSEGQKTRMRTTLETQRTSLLSSLGCMPVYARDAGITAVISPAGVSCNTTYTPVVKLTNFGSQALTSCTINYNIDGVGSSTFAWTGNIASGAFANITLPQVIATSGAHEFYAWSSNPNGQNDENSSNNQSTSNFAVTSGATVELTVQVDYFGSETTWEILDDNNAQIAYGGPYANNSQGTIYSEMLCLPNGCYTLVFHDQYGDGQSFTSGNYALHGPEGEILASASGNWGSISSTPFCIDSAPVGEAPTASFTVSDNTICAGGNTSFNFTGTNNPTNFIWTFNGASNNSSTNIAPGQITYNTPGVYNVTLTVSNEFGSDSYTCTNCVTVISGPTVNINSVNPTCSGLSNGGATANVTGGYSPFSYTWNTGGTSNAISNIGAGSYSVTVTNSEGCSTQATATVNNPTPLQVSVFSTNVICNGSDDGSAVASSNGGTGTINYSWSTGSNQSFAANLGAGSYAVTATDANGCSDMETFTITEPTLLVASTIVLSPETCAGNDGSASIEVDGGAGGYTIVWGNGSESLIADGLSSGNYFVSVADANGCSLNINVNIPYDCDTPAPVTKLVQEDCGSTDVALNAVLTCESVAGAGMYQWKFSTPTGLLITEDFTLGTEYYLGNSNAFTGNTLMLVTIKAMLDGSWGPYGEVCSIQTEQTFGTTELTASDCGSTIDQWGNQITAEMVPGVLGYQWSISGGQDNFTFNTTENTLALSEDLGLINNQLYQVSVRCLIGDNQYTPWGNTCDIQIAVVLGVDEFVQNELFIYPNPNNGENITLEFGNISGNSRVSDIVIYNAAGSIVENMKQMSLSAGAQKIQYHFQHPLASGVYLVHYSINGQEREEKLIVR